MNRNQIDTDLRSLSYTFDVDYTTVFELANCLGIEDNYRLLIHYLQTMQSLDFFSGGVE
jgi:hypothetical protein